MEAKDRDPARGALSFLHGKGLLAVGALLLALAPLTVGCGARAHTADTVPREHVTGGGHGRATPGDEDAGSIAKPTAITADPASLPQPSVESPTLDTVASPDELTLTRAAHPVFDVRDLVSTVVKHERPEDDGPSDSDDDDNDAGGSGGDSGAKTTTGAVPNTPSTPAPSPTKSFEGLDFATFGAGHPPDTNGDVGPTYYIQVINTSIGIFDKSNGNRVAAFTFDSFMSQGNFGNLCDTNNFGDPVVLYDSFEDRWILTDFAFKLDGSGNVNPQTVFECFAVSKSGDPVTGGWNYYSVLAPGGLADYPKLGIWPDGIYMSANMFGYASGAGFTAPHVWALDKAEMYAGAPTAQMVDFAAPSADFTLLPANARLQTGTPPPGTPEYFVATEEFLNGLTVYKLHVDWNKISTSTFTGPDVQLAPTCWPAATPANASTTGNAADVLAIRAMAQAQYTNLGGAESIWVDHTVQRGQSANNTNCNATTGGNAAVRWYQLNVTGGAVAANTVQGTTWDPDGANTFFRFVPSLAVDRMGDLAVGYSKSNATTPPQIKYAGQLAGDPVNTFSQGEQTLIDGTGSQTGNCGSSACIRWGDYSGMALDPSDGCTFWMTNEYFVTSGLNFNTRIGSFSYPSCTPVGNGTLSGTVTNGASPIAGVTVAFGSRTATTDSSGDYSFTVPAGTYPTITASKAGFGSASASTLVVPNGSTLTKNFNLAAAATNGCFTDDTQSDFQTGVPNGCDLTASPGDVQLTENNAADQSNTTVTSNGFAVNSTSWVGQTFVPSVTGKVTKVDLDLFCSGCTGTTPNLTASIRATTGSPAVPTGADLVNGTITGFSSGSGGYLAASFASPVTLTAGTTYAIVLRATSNPSAGTYAYVCSCTTDSNPYASGQRVTSTNSGTSWTADTTSGGRDLGFDVWLDTGFTPSATLVSSLKDANPAAGSTPTWTTLSFTDTTPASTSVKFQIAASNSVNGPFAFVGPDGTAATFFTTSGADISRFNGFRYLEYEAFLATTNTSITPELSSVSVCFADIAPAVGTALAVNPASGVFGGTVDLSATLTSSGVGVTGKSVAFTLNGSSVGSAPTNASGVATVTGVSLTGINAGSYPTGVSASFAGDASDNASTGSNALAIAKADQAITVTTHAPASAAFNSSFGVAASGGGSGNAVTFSSSGSCSNTGAAFTITSGTGACSVLYDEAGTLNYNAALEVTETVAATKLLQTISVTTHAPASAAFNSSFGVAASGGASGNAVTFSSSGSCGNTGATFTMTSGTGTCSVMYDEAGNANYSAATQVTEAVSATKLPQTITVTTHAPASAAFNSNFSVAASGGASGNAVTFSSNGVCTNAGATFTITSGSGVCSVMYDEAGNVNYSAATQVAESVTASKLAQTITVTTHAPASAANGTSFTVAANGGPSGNAVTFTSSGACTNTGASFTMTGGTGTCAVKYDQAGSANYNAATQVTESVSAQAATTTTTTTTTAATTTTATTTTTTTTGATTTTTATSTTNTTTTSTPTSTATSTSTSTTTATTTGGSPGSGTTTGAGTVQKADQTITFPTIPGKTYGDPDFDPGATSSAKLAVTYTTTGNCSVNNGRVRLGLVGSCTVTAAQSGDQNTNAATPVSLTLAIKAKPLTITATDRSKPYGVALSLGSKGFTTAGLIGGDGVASVSLRSAGARAGALLGPHAIVAGAAIGSAGTDLHNYAIRYVAGTLTVRLAGLTGLTAASVGGQAVVDTSTGRDRRSNQGSAAVLSSNGPISIGAATVHGSVRSTGGSVTLQKGALVTGGVTAGTTIANDGTIRGKTTQRSPSTAVPSARVSRCAQFSAPSGFGGHFTYDRTSGNLTVAAGKTVTLAAGSYCFHNIVLSGGATLAVKGQVSINLTGTLSAGQATLVNSTGSPSSLVISSSYSGTSGIVLAGGSEAYLDVFAPRTGIVVAVRGQVFGALLGETLTLSGGSHVHADIG